MKKIFLTTLPALFVIGLAFAAFSGCKKETAGGLKTNLVSAEKNSFKEVTSQLDAGGNLYLYLSTEQLLDGVSGRISQWRDTLASMPGADAEQRAKVEKTFDTVTRLVKECGVEDISGFGASSIATEPGFYHTKAFLHHYPNHGDGFLWKVMGHEPHALSGLDLLSTNTALAAFSDVDLPLVWSVIQKEGGAAGIPELKEFLDNLPRQFETATGVPWEKVLNSLGGEFGVVVTFDESRKVRLPLPTSEPFEVPEPGLMIVLKVKDDTIFNRLDAKLAELPPQVTQPLIRVDQGKLKMRTMPVPLPLPLPLRPTVATSDGYLFIATSDAMVQEALAVRSGQRAGLKSTEEFKHLAKDIPTEGNQFTFVSQRFGQTVFRIQQQAMAMSASTQPAQQQWLQSLIHSDKQVFSYCVSANTDQGWLTIANGNQHPAKMFLAAAVVPVGVLSAIAIPNFIKARQTSQVNACLNNLRQIDGAKQQWALENGKHASDVPTEADLKVYLGRGTAGVTFPVCPQGGRYTINPVDKNPTCSVHGDILK